jgi:hypothetical protein
VARDRCQAGVAEGLGGDAGVTQALLQEGARSDTRRLVVADRDPLPSAAAAILEDGPVIHQDPS